MGQTFLSSPLRQGSISFCPDARISHAPVASDDGMSKRPNEFLHPRARGRAPAASGAPDFSHHLLACCLACLPPSAS